MNQRIKMECDITKIDQEKKLVYGKVLVPETIDKQNDIITKEDVERVAHEFMMGFQNISPVNKSEMGYQHRDIGNQGLYVVESWIDPEDGSWNMGTYVDNDKIWEQVKKGQVTGYSIGGKAFRREVEVEIEE